LKITDIRTVPICVPLKDVFGGSTYAIRERRTIITEVMTDEGVKGRIFNGDIRDQQAEVMKIIHSTLKPLLLGEDPLCVERCWHKMFTATKNQGNRALICSAIAAVDNCLWDLLGKACGLPVYKLIGGCRDEVKPIIIGGYYGEGKTLGMLCDEMHEIKENGYAGCKVKVGGLSPLEDAERITAIRKSIGDDFIIACDANQGWTRFEAVQFGLKVRDLNIAWFEEPVLWSDYIPGMRFVREHTGLAVTAGQSDFFHDGCRAMIENRAVDIINHDISGGSGVTDWLKIARMADLFEVKMAHHEDALIAMHLLAGIRLGLYPEYFSEARDPVTPHILADQPKPRSGVMKLPSKPGFSMEFDEDFVEKYRVD